MQLYSILSSNMRELNLAPEILNFKSLNMKKFLGTVMTNQIMFEEPLNDSSYIELAKNAIHIFNKNRALPFSNALVQDVYAKLYQKNTPSEDQRRTENESKIALLSTLSRFPNSSYTEEEHAYQAFKSSEKKLNNAGIYITSNINVTIKNFLNTYVFYPLIYGEKNSINNTNKYSQNHLFLIFLIDICILITGKDYYQEIDECNKMENEAEVYRKIIEIVAIQDLTFSKDEINSIPTPQFADFFRDKNERLLNDSEKQKLKNMEDEIIANYQFIKNNI